MAISIDLVIQNALEEAFARALDRVIQRRAESAFKKALENGSGFGKKLKAKIEQRLEHFLKDGFQREKRKTGFRK